MSAESDPDHSPADEEGDYITVRNQSDLEEAIAHTLETAQTSLKLYLSTDQSPYPSLGSFNNNNDTALSSSSVTSSSSQLNTATRRSSEMTSSHNSNRRSAEVTSPSTLKNKSKRVIRWQKGELLGEGGFGKVFLGMHTDTGELIAVKQVTIPRENADASAKVTALQKEIELMQDLDHENIVRYLGSERVEDKLNIFLEYQSGGSIATLLSKFKQFNEKIIRSFTKQILQGLKYLHDNGIAHRGKHVIAVAGHSRAHIDIKGGNILVDSNGTVKLADFGASKKLADIVSFSEGCKTVLGSPYWMAPEVIQQGYGNEGASASSYGRKADIWSVGAVVIEMATGRPPFAELAPVTALFKIGSSGQIPASPATLSDKAKDFLTLCFQRDVKLRPSASELLAHIFFQDEDERAQLDDDTSSTRLSSLTSSQGSLFGTASSVKSSDKLSKSPPSVKPTPPPHPPPIPATPSKAESAESDEEEDLDDVISFLRERTQV